MRKFILVLFVGLVLALNLYGIVNECVIKELKEVNHIEETTIKVYME